MNNKTQGNIGYAILGFFVPVAGLILFLVWRDEKPGDAKYAGIGALVSVIASVIGMIIIYIIMFLMVFAFSQYAI